MVAFGHSAGARHLRTFGNVRNLLSYDRLTFEEIKDKNERLLGMGSLFWHYCLSGLPSEITDTITKALESADLPPIQAEGIVDGMCPSCSNQLFS